MTTISVASATAGEKDKYMDFVVSLSGPSAVSVSVNYLTQRGAADSARFVDYDYVGVSGTLAFAAGETSKTVRVELVDDSTFERTQSFILSLSSPINAVLGDDVAVGTIIDNDKLTTAPVIQLSDAIVDESDGRAYITVTLDLASASPVSVSFATADGTATAGSDYQALSDQIVSFAPGETAKTIAINLLDDTATEPGESFELVFSSPTGGASLLDTKAHISIGSSDQAVQASPVITVTDATASESVGYMDFVVSLSGASTKIVSVNYLTYHGSAESQVASSSYSSYDYTGIGGTISFAEGETTKTIRVAITDDANFEKTEGFVLTLSTAVNAVTGIDVAVGTIIDNDKLTTTPVIQLSDAIVDESDGRAYITVTLDLASASPVSVSFSTADGTATAGSDYQALSNQIVSFAPGETAKTIAINLLDDTATEPGEYFELVFTSPTGGATLLDTKAHISIGSSDQAVQAIPVITVADAVASESVGYMDFVLSLSGPSSKIVSANYVMESGSAESAYSSAGYSSYDYAGFQGTIAFAAGETTKTLRVAISDDTNFERTEGLFLTLSKAVNAAIGNISAVGTIIDNDKLTTAPVIQLSDAIVDESDGRAYITVTLDLASASPVSVSFSTADGTATAGSDYQALSNQIVSFAPGETAKTIGINLLDDTATEIGESFELVFTGPTGGATLLDTKAHISIGSSDQAVQATPVITVTDATASESVGYMDFVASLSAPSAQAVSVRIVTVEGSAESSKLRPFYSSFDYPGLGNTLVFAAGETSKILRLPITDDSNIERTESFTLQMSAALNAVLGNATAVGTIIDNDKGTSTSTVGVTTTPAITVRDAIVDESDGRVYITVKLDLASAIPVSVSFATADGTATAGSDYQALSKQIVSFAPGETSKTIAIALLDDTSAESGEHFDLVLSNATGDGTLPDTTARVYIGASDQDVQATPLISVSDAIASESDGYVEFVVGLNGPSTQTVSINYATSYGTAYIGLLSGGWDYYEYDYGDISGTLAFAAGETTKTVRVPLVDNNKIESIESFSFSLTKPLNATIGNSTALGTIVDNDKGPTTSATGVTTTPVIRVSDAIVDESDGRAYITVMLDIASTSEVLVSFRTADGSATAGSDYQALVSQTIGFGPGETAKTIAINLIDDASVESAEYFDVVFFDPTGGATLPDTEALVFIGASEQALQALPAISASTAVANEADGYMDFVVSLSAPSATTVTVSYATSRGTALSGTGSAYDYGDISGTLAFAAGETIKTVRVSITHDSNTEDSETFNFKLTSPVNATVATSTVTGTIRDDGSAPISAALDVTGTLGNDVLIGRDTADTLKGVEGDDVIVGGGGNDMLNGGPGNDVLMGGAGDDTAVYIGSRETYSVSTSGGVTTISSTGEGIDTLSGIEFVNFAGQTLAMATIGTTVVNGTTVNGTTTNDILTGSSGDDSIDGKAGMDTAVNTARMAAYTTSTAAISGPDGSDTLASIERLQFADANLAFDLDGNAGQTYRLYQASFNRTPDLAGLGGWIAAMDSGTTPVQVASSFMASDEFKSLYGASTTNAQFVSLLYANALHRSADAGGLAGWVDELASGRQTRAQVLINFSESGENKASVLPAITNGIVYATATQAAGPAKGQAFAGTTGADSLIGSVGNDTLTTSAGNDTINAGFGNDSITGGTGNDTINGGGGLDTAIFSGNRATYTTANVNATLTVSGGTDGTDTLTNVERLKFDDAILAFDASGNAGQTYRLYQAAFNRTPDKGGLTGWVNGVDSGMTMLKVAAAFIESGEFKALYGASPTDAEFVNLLYTNALHRTPDQGGLDYWVNQLSSNSQTREQALLGFSESVENQASLIGVIQGGIELAI